MRLNIWQLYAQILEQKVKEIVRTSTIYLLIDFVIRLIIFKLESQ
jgi:hypothetical protein